MQLAIKHPHFPEGMEFGISGLGVLKNFGEALEVDEDTAKAYLARTGKTVEEMFGDKEHFSIDGKAGTPSTPPAKTETDDSSWQPPVQVQQEDEVEE